MRNTRIFLTTAVVFAFSLAAVNFAVADTIVYEFGTKAETKGDDVALWSVANITPTGYTNGVSKKDANGNTRKDSNGNILWEKDEEGTSFSSSFLQFDNKGLSGVNFGDVRALSNSELGASWNTSNSGWITPATSTNNGYNSNGFYAYRLQFSLELGSLTLDNFLAEFTATAYSDDYIAGIFLNGVEFAADQVANAQKNSWNTPTAVSFEYQANVPLYAEGNELIVVVHNNREFKNEERNATGLNMILGINSNAKITIDEPGDGGFSTTPEPATLLILGLGAAGAAFARRRKNA